MSKKFVPPKLDMGPAFATASSIKTKEYKGGKKGTRSPQPIDTATSPIPGGKRKLNRQRTVAADAVPLTLANLAEYFDWRQGPLEESVTLFKLASVIWSFLPDIPMSTYAINFAASSKLTVMQQGLMMGNILARPPAIATVSPKGDVVIMVEGMKRLDEWAEKQFMIILFPSICSCRCDEDTVQTATGAHCTFWEVTDVEHLTHLAMDRFGVIYFTTGESVFRIMKADGDMYLDTFEEIFAPGNDTSHITCLWRQANEVFFAVQDWDAEDNLDVYKIKVAKDRGVARPDSPLGAASPTAASSTAKKRTRTRSGSGAQGFGGYGSGSGYGSDANSPGGGGGAGTGHLEYVVKLRTFSLEFNQRIWQLGSLRYEKKFMLAMGASQTGSAPKLLRIGFKQKMKVLELFGARKGVVWPHTAPDAVPHSVYAHKQSKSWFCVLPVTQSKKGGLFWVQFRLDKTKKKVSWHRLVPVPAEAAHAQWLYYDETRDLLLGFESIELAQNEYRFVFLPDMTKRLFVADDDSSESASIPRTFRGRRKSVDKAAADRRPHSPVVGKRRGSGKTSPQPKLSQQDSASVEPNIRPSKAKKETTKPPPPRKRKVAANNRSIDADNPETPVVSTSASTKQAKSRQMQKPDINNISSKSTPMPKHSANPKSSPRKKKQTQTQTPDSKKKKRPPVKKQMSTDLDAATQAMANIIQPLSNVKAANVQRMSHKMQATEFVDVANEEEEDEDEQEASDKAKFSKTRKKSGSNASASSAGKHGAGGSPRKSPRTPNNRNEDEEDVMD